ncbi:Ribosomal-protein-serine acetyltransferase [Acaryochloris thomasi RCC1774]|uniref:Ribosomal-protein-serine acetyltransferase n=1 Tax=Acaryochloris thomasi RCC1774 TaxID=1764569 RepID=A0A2W1JNB8_9CYAN|nr:GNAT family protein [Acaryochloris thomasi]PZD74823.1 Ribosomal-protein-serine acetyltransferase [Acaryochloris thomasi RCC1774]
MISLRDYTSTDVERLLELANNKRVSQYLVDTFPYPRADAAWWINIGCREKSTITKVIEYKGEFVGSIGLTSQTGWRQHLAEMGYWLGEAYWGQGIATAALQEMTDTAFTLGYRKLYAPVLATNTASMRVLEKCSYRLEGILKSEVLKNDQYFDIHHYARCCSGLIGCVSETGP